MLKFFEQEARFPRREDAETTLEREFTSASMERLSAEVIGKREELIAVDDPGAGCGRPRWSTIWGSHPSSWSTRSSLGQRN
jgi:hypothetical protein